MQRFCRECGRINELATSGNPVTPLPSSPVIIERKRLVAELIVLALLVGVGLVLIYAASNYWYMQGYDNGHADGTNGTYNNASASGQNAGQQQGYNDGYAAGKTDGYAAGKTDGYAAGKTDGYNSGYANGKNDGYNSGYATGLSDGKNQELNDLYDFITTGSGGANPKPCMPTSDRPDYVYFKMIKDNSGITYECLVPQ